MRRRNFNPAAAGTGGGEIGERAARRPGRNNPLSSRHLASTIGRWTAILFGMASGLLLLSPAAGTAGAPTVLHHDLSVTLFPDNGVLSGKDTLTIRPDGGSRISLVLGKNVEVTRLEVGGKALQPEKFEPRDGKVEIPVPEDARDGELEASVFYRGAFRDPVPENPVNTEDPGYGVTGSITPRGTFLSADAGWYPDIPGSSATFRLRVEAPEGTWAVSSGKLVGRESSGGTSRTEWETLEPLPEIELSAGRYEVGEKVADGVPVYTFFLPENEALSKRYLDAASGYLALFRGLFGPYPFEKFAVVENFFPTGFAYPSYTLIGSDILRLPFLLETSLGHEIAHSWWGIGVRVDYSRGNWSEGLVTCVADLLFKERASAAEGREYRLKLLQDYATLVPPRLDFPLKDFTVRTSPVSRAVGYGKAAMVFHMARKEAGEERFWAGLQAVFREKFGRTASWDDFDRALPRERSADPASFFRQWVDRPGAPVIALADVKATPDGSRWKVTGRVVQQKTFYELIVPLRLESRTGSADASLPLTGEDARFTIYSDSRPVRLVVDPDVDLFRRLDPSEIPPSINGIRGSESLVAVAARRITPELLKASKTLLEALGKGDVPVLREEAVSPRDLAGRDVLFLGLPGGSGILPPFPKGLAAEKDRFTLEGVEYSSPSDALFAVFGHPSDKGRVAALFLPLSADAAVKAARKIPHYGKYGYLAFSDGVNKAKGSWETTGSPTIHEFPPEPITQK